MAVTKYPLGVNYDYPLILKKLLLTPLDYAPSQEIIYAGRRVYDYRGYYKRLNRLASGLSRLGVTRSSLVAVLDYNSHRYLECLFAIPMMGATLPMLQDLSLSATDLNRIAGFTINTLDPVGLAVLVSAGRRFSSFAVPAIKGALVGILLRGVLHLAIF